jgi:hypothetical protein
LLFHNGKWDEWRKETFDHAAQLRVKLPANGLLNDSRMIAWHAHHFGETVLQIINQKTLVFGLEPDGKTVRFQLYGPKKDDKNPHGWTFMGDETTLVGVHYSNEKWEKHLAVQSTASKPKAAPIATLYDIKRQIAGRGGDRPADSSFQPSGQHCNGGSSVFGREPVKDEVEGRPETTQGGAAKTGKLIDDQSLRARFAAVHNDNSDALQRALNINPATLTRRVIGYLGEKKDLVH